MNSSCHRGADESSVRWVPGFAGFSQSFAGTVILLREVTRVMQGLLFYAGMSRVERVKGALEELVR